MYVPPHTPYEAQNTTHIICMEFEQHTTTFMCMNGLFKIGENRYYGFPLFLVRMHIVSIGMLITAIFERFKRYFVFSTHNYNKIVTE